MKKLLFAFLLAGVFIPSHSLAAIGAGCNVDSDCDVNAGEWCDNPSGGTFLCKGPSSSSSSGAGTANTSTGGYVPIAPIPGLTDTSTVGTGIGNLETFFNNLYIFLIGVAAALAVVEIIIGGAQYATTDNISKKSEGRARITQAILGLVLILLPVLVFSIINPNILTLSLSWSPIQAGSKQTPFGTSSSSGSQTTTSGGTTQNVTGTYLKTATFSSTQLSTASNDATQWQQTNCNTASWSTVRTNSNCQGGFNQSGQCVSGVTAYAICSFSSPTSFPFIDIQTGFIQNNLAFQYNLKALDSNGTSYVDTCAADGGIACIAKGSTFTTLSPCPSFPPGFTVPQGAPNAQSGGTCYTSKITCSPNNNLDKSYVCRGDVTITR